MEQATDRRTRAQALMRGKADGAGMQLTSHPEASWEFGGDPAATSWEQARGGGRLSGSACSAPVPPSRPLILPVSTVPQSK